MKLSVSNIGWSKEMDEIVFPLLQKYEFCGLEIAPTRIFSEKPYEKKKEAKEWKEQLKKKYSLQISSMQSIWYGRQENIFGTFEEKQALIDYTKQAIDFAEIIGCGNLVFGCPKNRNIPEGVDSSSAIKFFREVSEYAVKHHTTIGMEANPPIYNTNYINDTISALRLIQEVGSDGFRLNLDVGTMIQNKEDISELVGKVYLVNHVHISEPELKPIVKRELHTELKNLLKDEGYQGFISIEMGKTDDQRVIENALSYVKEIFI